MEGQLAVSGIHVRMGSRALTEAGLGTRPLDR